MELVSVIIPNYNNDKYLPQCIDSVLSQSYQNVEIIIVDDASTDRSIDILHDYEKKNKNINVIINQSNTGVSNARNIAINACSGKYATTLDSDDYYCSSDKILNEVSTLQDYYRDGVMNAIAYSGIKLFDNRNKEIPNKKKLCNELGIEKILLRECMIPRDYMATKTQLVEAGLYDNKIPIYEDWDLKIRLAVDNAFYYVGSVGVGYRIHDEGLSSANTENLVKWMKYVFKKNIHHIRPDKRWDVERKFQKECIEPMYRTNNIFINLAKALHKYILN